MTAPKPRHYQVRDRDACLAVFDSNRPRYFTDGERPLFERFLDTEPDPYYVIEDEQGLVVACGGYAVDEAEGQASFCWGMVRDDCHGQGLGRLLSETRLAGIRADARVSRVRLDTSQRTRGFYEGLGFRLLSVAPGGYGPGLDRCEMLLELSAPTPAGA